MNTFHCLTPDCTFWVFIEENVNNFFCEVCHRFNCIKCKALHDAAECLRLAQEKKQKTDEDIKTEQEIKNLILFGKAMKCPSCSTLIMKDGGCDALRCKSCKLQICWATKGPRWGPKGVGDFSGGCQCHNPALRGKRCSDHCRGCDFPHNEPLRWHRFVEY